MEVTLGKLPSSDQLAARRQRVGGAARHRPARADGGLLASWQRRLGRLREHMGDRRRAPKGADEPITERAWSEGGIGRRPTRVGLSGCGRQSGTVVLQRRTPLSNGRTLAGARRDA